MQWFQSSFTMFLNTDAGQFLYINQNAKGDVGLIPREFPQLFSSWGKKKQITMLHMMQYFPKCNIEIGCAESRKIHGVGENEGYLQLSASAGLPWPRPYVIKNLKGGK